MKWRDICLCLALSTMIEGCGGQAESGSPASRKAGISYRVLAVVNDPHLSVVSFNDLAHPHTIEIPLPSAAYRTYALNWNHDGKRLVAKTTNTDVSKSFLFSLSFENWTATKLLFSSADPLTSAWLSDDRYLVVFDDRWNLLDVKANQYDEGPSSERRLRAWFGKDSASYLVQNNTNYYWFHAQRDPVEVRSDRPLSVFATSDPSKMLLSYLGDPPPEASVYDNFWSMKGVAQTDCTPTDVSGQDCLPRFSLADGILGTSLILIQAVSRGAEGIWQSILVREFGNHLPLSTNAQDPGVIHAWGPNGGERCFPLVSQRIWLYCVDGEDRVHLERLEVTPEGTNSVYSTALEPIADTFRSPFVVGGLIFGHEPSEDYSHPETWKMLDLRKDQVDWEPVDARGELIMPLGERGAIFIDTQGDPEDLSRACAPCSFTAVKDIFNPSSLILTGTFNAPFAPAYPDLQKTFWPAPDGSGVLTLEDGVLFYENFSAPGVRFPLTEVAEGSSIYLPPTWGD